MENLVDNPIIQNLLENYQNEAVRVFKREVKNSGKVWTGDMLNSIRASAIERGKDFLTASIQYSEVLRLKDIKQLNFTTIPPHDSQKGNGKNSIQQWVESNLGFFSFVPGYKGKHPDDIDEDIAIKRITGAVVFSLRREPNVKRGYRGIYNEPLTKDVLPRFWRDLRQSAGAHALTNFRQIFQD